MISVSGTIQQIDRGEKKRESQALIKKKYRLQSERASKKEKKYDKQMQKLERDLKEVEAAENQSTKLKLVYDPFISSFICNLLHNLICFFLGNSNDAQRICDVFSSIATDAKHDTARTRIAGSVQVCTSNRCRLL